MKKQNKDNIEKPVKKATTKRERKYGKKNEEGVKTKAPSRKERSVRLIVDGYTILKFPSLKAAQAYIDKENKISAAKRQKPTSFVFL